MAELITAALTRDTPGVRFEAKCPQSDADNTAKEAANKYKRLFETQNDLFQIQTQIANYMCTDGRVVTITDHIIDAQTYGRDPLVETKEEPVPENEAQLDQPLIFIVRHGETDKNTEGRIRGDAPDGLNELGQRQAEKVSQFLKDKGITQIVCSPIPRSTETAQHIASALGVPYVVDERIEAFDMGTMTGESTQDNAEDLKAIFAGDEAAPGGENAEEFDNRVGEALMVYLQAGQIVAIVAHDSVIASIAKFINPDVPYGPSSIGPGGVAVIEAPDSDKYAFRPVYPTAAETVSAGIERGIPRGQEHVEVCGKLEAKVVPINVQEQQEMIAVNVSKEYDLSYIKAKFPEKADQIQPGGTGIAEIELDRIARVNVALSLEASYITGDSMVTDVTLHRVWMRPCMFMEAEDPEARKELFDNFPDGVKVYLAGDTFLRAYNEKLDDHVHVSQALPGTGQNRKSLCSSLMPIQRRLNTWMDLLDAFATRVVAQRYIASEVFNVDAISQQSSGPGPYIPFMLNKIPAGKGVQDMIWVEPTPQAQPWLFQLIIYFIEQLPQLIAHAMPTLFGSQSNEDKVQPMSGIAMAMQRDQALGAISSPWHALKMAWCKIYLQAVQLASLCRNHSIHETAANGEAVDIEIDNLRGGVVCFPEEDSNIPTTFSQKQAQWQQAFATAIGPVAMALSSEIRNIKGFLDAYGLRDFKSSKVDAYDKQLGELEVLLASGPVPNPQRAALEVQLEQLKAQAGSQMAFQAPLTTEQEMQLAQMQQAIDALPPMVSSVQIKPTDDNAAEAECLLNFINEAQGRKLANGTAEEQAAFENINLHLREHQSLIKPPEPQVKPPSESINFKDLPPDPAAQLLQKAGLATTGQDVVLNREHEAEIKKSSKVGGPPPVPIVPPTAGGVQ
jgi:probable phosphoglycerate mutase